MYSLRFRPYSYYVLNDFYEETSPRCCCSITAHRAPPCRPDHFFEHAKNEWVRFSAARNIAWVDWVTFPPRAVEPAAVASRLNRFLRKVFKQPSNAYRLTYAPAGEVADVSDAPTAPPMPRPRALGKRPGRAAPPMPAPGRAASASPPSAPPMPASPASPADVRIELLPTPPPPRTKTTVAAKRAGRKLNVK